jgi:ribosome-associated protein
VFSVSYRSRPAARRLTRELAVERFTELLRDALKQVPKRKKIRVSRAAKLRRLEEKKQHSVLKQERSKRVPVED